MTRKHFTGGVATLLAALLLGTALQAGEPKTPAPPAAKKPDGEGWANLLDTKSLKKWEVVKKYDFADHGKVELSKDGIVLEYGSPATGVKWTGDFPKVGYEVTLEARRVYGDDFFCGLTFPVGDKTLTLVCGGWGGQVTGLSCIDGESAIENDTCTFHEYKQKQWYRIRLVVRGDRIDAWLDDEQIVDLPLKARQLSLRWEMEPAEPFGICTWQTSGEIRKLRYRLLDKKLPVKGQEPHGKPE